MSAITLDEMLVKKVPSLHESTEIRHASGKVLGVYTPVEGSCYNQQIPQHLLDKIDWDEVERRSKSTHPGYTLKEVWEHIDAMKRRG